jgi:phosphohistidine phosphatase SixA
LVPINLNKLKKLKKEDELHIYDTYRAYLQTQEEFTLEIKIMKSKVGIISHKPFSFNHVNTIMDVYTQSSKKFSVSGIIKLVYDCIQWKLNVYLNM